MGRVTIHREQQEALRQYEAELRAKQEKEMALFQWMGSMLECKRTVKCSISLSMNIEFEIIGSVGNTAAVRSIGALCGRRGAVCPQHVRPPQRVQETDCALKAAVRIQSYVRGTAWRLQCIRVSQQIQTPKEQEAQEQRERALRKRECMESLLTLYRLHQFQGSVREKRRLLALRHSAATAIQP